MSQQPKISDLLKKNAEEGGQFVSFEFFPPKTEAGDEKLKGVLAEFATQNPVFVDFTWGAGGSTSEKTTQLCELAKSMGFTTNMHLTCTNMDVGKVDSALNFCLKNGIRNIVALRGDPPAGQQWKDSEEGFNCALDLVKYIRTKHGGEYFSLAVAGYPEGHPDKIDGSNGNGKVSDEVMDAEIAYLKQKIDAGADYIITQLFFDNSLFIDFVKKCRAKGITAPILPGMLPVQTYAGFNRMTSLCKTFVPDSLKAKVEALKDSTDEEFRKFGVELTAAMVQELKEHGIHHIHYYTLNQSTSTLEILAKLGQKKN